MDLEKPGNNSAPKLLRRRDLTLYELDDELLIFDPRTSDTHRLNATARSIWRCCNGKTDAHEMAARMTTAYDVDLPSALDHVRRILGELQTQGLVMHDDVQF